jgi:UDP-N-acetylmuramoylalanine--D-glutamate ligase
MSDDTPTTTPEASRVPPMQGISVLVLGIGASGLAMASWCVRRGATVTVWDSRLGPADTPAGTHPELALHRQSLQALPLQAGQPPVRWLGGALLHEQAGEHLAEVRWVLKSPGLAPHDTRIAPLLQAAGAAQLPVWGELDLFHRELSRLKNEHGYAPAVLAVTGTNGKTTTTALTGRLVERTGRRVAVAGNIGPSLLDTLQAALDVAQPTPDANPDLEQLPQVWVLELSSFQLHGVEGFQPSAGSLLNLSQDHLDWHGSMAAYGADKARVWGASPTTVMVVNRDDALVSQLAAQVTTPPTATSPTTTRDSTKAKAASARAAAPARTVVSFGLDAPQHPGDFGLVQENGMAWLVRAVADDEPASRRRGSAAVADTPVHLQRLMPADALRIRGRHNAANALAALALATAIGCPLAPMLHGLREYNGEPHRMQFVLTIDGVDAFDDSKGTNVGATVAALLGLGADREPGRLAVILGGDGKGQDFTPLAVPLARHARCVATIGRDAAAIESAVAAACAEATVPLQRHDTLEAAVAWCYEAARSGDAVLLSPACASLDMFRNYGHRAEVFVHAVQTQAEQRGIVG